MVVADTSPVNYLILIQRIELLTKLFEVVTLPQAVVDELSSPDAPREVREWIANPPEWIKSVDIQNIPPIAGLHKGETAAIALAEQQNATLLLIDERKGAEAARKLGIRVTGTLGLLELAAQRGITDFADAAYQLRKTSFRVSNSLLELLMQRNTAHQK